MDEDFEDPGEDLRDDLLEEDEDDFENELGGVGGPGGKRQGTNRKPSYTKQAGLLLLFGRDVNTVSRRLQPSQLCTPVAYSVCPLSAMENLLPFNIENKQIDKSRSESKIL